MKIAEIKKHFQNELEEMEKYRLISINAQLEFENAEKNHDPNLAAYEKAVKQAEKEEDAFSENFSMAIFDYLKDSNPKLIRRRNNQEVDWKEAFGSDFSQLSTELKGSLIALIEDDGGQYRLC